MPLRNFATHKADPIGPKDLGRVYPKAVAHPTDARMMYRAISKFVGPKRNGVPLRQSYWRLAKLAVMVGRYTHAHQFNRARRQRKFISE